MIAPIATTMLVQSGYSKDKTVYQFTGLTLDNWRTLPDNCELMALDKNEKLRRVKMTSVKTWKTRSDVRIGWKYGLYEYGYTTLTADGQEGVILGWAEIAE
jgi:hypothetical protein